MQEKEKCLEQTPILLKIFLHANNKRSLTLLIHEGFNKIK